ncbi:putative mage family protein [Botrytis fragariae]|uniref:Putative mage family protein n=1 Tax=Botrytis fragariae TaxID=1964551 RepID=A0A8H6ATH8_9HELO|nr:putative mage family protein [Botrytis fragariae]KAF5873321.1 putative mage family protein [Botrytis fragariae]
MPANSRRGGRDVVKEDEESEDEIPRNTQQRHRSDPESEEEDADDDEEDAAGAGIGLDREESLDQVVKKLVRYALACEFQRLPITRTGIKEKVLGAQSRSFKSIFEPAQESLRIIFGMEMVELPAKENVTVKGRLKEASRKSKSTTTSSYILTSILPIDYRSSSIIQPSKVISQWDEATYIGFYTMVVSVIMLSPDSTMTDSKLMSVLRKLNAETNLPLDKTTLILKKMMQQNYITRTIERNDGEELIEWRVGPRGRMEIGSKGVQGLVKEVYGEHAPEDLDKRLERSLGLGKRKATHGENGEGTEVPERNEASSSKRGSARGRPRRGAAEEEEDEDDE